LNNKFLNYLNFGRELIRGINGLDNIKNESLEKSMKNNPKEKKIYESAEEIVNEVVINDMQLNPNLRYKKYKELVKIENRMWDLNYHAMYLLCNNLMSFLVISYMFRSLYKKNSSQLMIFKSFSKGIEFYNLKYFAFSASYLASFLFLYYFSRYYIYNDAYKKYYAPNVISNKDFLDLYDSIIIKKRMKEGI